MCQYSTFRYYKDSKCDLPGNLTEGIGHIFLLHASLLRVAHLTTMGTFISEKTFFISVLQILKKPQHFIALFKISFQKPSKEQFGKCGSPSGGLAVLIICSKPSLINNECVYMKRSQYYGSVH